MTKKLAIIGAAVMTTLLALMIFWQFRIVVAYVAISLTLAAALRPLINRLVGRSFLIRASWILIYLVVVGALAGLLFLSGDIAINEIDVLAHTVSVQNEWKLPVWLQGSAFQQMLTAQLPPPGKMFEAVTGEKGQLVLPAMLGLTQGIGGAISDVLVILFLSVYWSISQVHFERLWLSLLPSDQRKQARSVWRTIEFELGGYIRSELIQSLMAGLLLGFGYWLLGSPYPALLAWIGAFVWLIPVVGAPLAVITPLLIGLLTSVQLGLTTAIYTLILLVSLQMWAEPALFRRKWDNPILTLVILLALADAFGLVGILVAPPLSAICQILWNLLFSNRAAQGTEIQVSDLKERQARVWETVNAMDGAPMALVTSSLGRLTQLIDKAEPILNASLKTEPGGLPQTSRSDIDKVGLRSQP